MSRRTERVGNLIRNIIGQFLLARMSDPRINPAATSITRVEVSDDMLAAKVFVSVMGSEGEQKLTLQALRHAAGYIQQHLGEEMQLRCTPVLDFRLDKNFKKTLDTLNAIQKAMDDVNRRQEARQAKENEQNIDEDLADKN